MTLITAKTTGPMSLVLFGLLCATAQGTPVTGNNAGCEIATTDFPTGPTTDFIPACASDDNGRGVLVLGNKLYFTFLSVGFFGPTLSIRVAPFNGGAGGPDIPGAALTNPRPGCGVQDLAYHDGFIYALTGYPGFPTCDTSGSTQLQVFKIPVGSTSAWSAPVTINPTPPGNGFLGPGNTADGFTLLVNNGVVTYLRSGSGILHRAISGISA
jgi:hypothetical protein